MTDERLEEIRHYWLQPHIEQRKNLHRLTCRAGSRLYSIRLMTAGDHVKELIDEVDRLKAQVADMMESRYDYDNTCQL